MSADAEPTRSSPRALRRARGYETLGCGAGPVAQRRPRAIEPNQIPTQTWHAAPIAACTGIASPREGSTLGDESAADGRHVVRWIGPYASVATGFVRSKRVVWACSPARVLLAIGLVGTIGCGPQAPASSTAAKSVAGSGEPSASSGDEPRAQGVTGPSKTAATTGEPDTASAAVGTTGADAADTDSWPTVGVEVCDEFLAAAKACLDGKTDEEAAKLRGQILEDAGYWKQTVEGGGAATAVAIGCETARSQLEARRESLGCLVTKAPGRPSKSAPP